MSGAYMSVERGAVVKGFATRITSKRTFGSLFFVRCQVTIEMRLLGEAFVAAGTFVRFLSSMGSLVSFEVIQTRVGLAADVAAMFFARLLGCWRVTIPGLNFLQLVNMT